MPKYLKLSLVVFGLIVLTLAMTILSLIVASGFHWATIQLIGDGLLALLLAFPAAILLMIGLFSLLNRWLLKRQLPGLFGAERPSARMVGLAVVVGLAMPLLLIGLFAMTGWGHLVWYGKAPWYLGAVAAVIIALGPGLIEEITYRWFLYGSLKRRIPKFWATFVVGLVFGAVHLNQVNTLAGAAILLIGAQLVNFMFVTVYERTGSIWCGAIVHMLWDSFTGRTGFLITHGPADISHALYPVAGLVVTAPSRLISGGEFGIETSVFTMALYLLVGYLLLRTRAGALRVDSP